MVTVCEMLCFDPQGHRILDSCTICGTAQGQGSPQKFPPAALKPYLLRRRHNLLDVGHGGLLLHYLLELRHLLREVNMNLVTSIQRPEAYLQSRQPAITHLELSSSGFLSLGDGCREKLGLDSWLELGGCSVGHLLLLLGRLCCLHRYLLGADLRKKSS